VQSFLILTCLRINPPTLNPNIRTVGTWKLGTRVRRTPFSLLIFINALATVVQFQSRHNIVYLMSFAAGKRLDVIFTIMKTAEPCNVSPRYAKGGGPKFFLARYAREILPPPSEIISH